MVPTYLEQKVNMRFSLIVVGLFILIQIPEIIL